jgi:hypothetical protein
MSAVKKAVLKDFELAEVWVAYLVEKLADK